mmetsp:Transcript_19524/g.51702  ORF Transcript_19524/g.51702 Transcript_19524/m.51702 type:complete len:431 (+) Transcript_19524:1-1293(+)
MISWTRARVPRSVGGSEDGLAHGGGAPGQQGALETEEVPPQLLVDPLPVDDEHDYAQEDEDAEDRERGADQLVVDVALPDVLEAVHAGLLVAERHERDHRGRGDAEVLDGRHRLHPARAGREAHRPTPFGACVALAPAAVLPAALARRGRDLPARALALPRRQGDVHLVLAHAEHVRLRRGRAVRVPDDVLVEDRLAVFALRVVGGGGVRPGGHVVDLDHLLLDVVAHHLQAVPELEEPGAQREGLLERREGHAAVAGDDRVHAEAEASSAVGLPAHDRPLGVGVHPLSQAPAAARSPDVDLVAEHHHWALRDKLLVHGVLRGGRHLRVVHGDVVHDARPEEHIVGQHGHGPSAGGGVLVLRHALRRRRVRGQRRAALPVVHAAGHRRRVHHLHLLRRMHHLFPWQRRRGGRQVVQGRLARCGLTCGTNR